MRSSYNRIAAQNIGRLAALSDGVFAVAMTLLVLDLRTPAETAIHSESDLRHAVVALAPRILVYLMSFLTLGISGLDSRRSSIISPAAIAISPGFISPSYSPSMPFSTSLMAAFISYRTALMIYWANIFVLGAILFAAWRYALRAQLVKRDLSPDVASAIERRIVIAQALYFVAALLCIINTYWSIGFILIVQLNYAIAPRLGPLSRI